MKEPLRMQADRKAGNTLNGQTRNIIKARVTRRRLPSGRTKAHTTWTNSGFGVASLRQRSPDPETRCAYGSSQPHSGPPRWGHQKNSNRNLVTTLICWTGLSRIRVKSNKARETPACGPPLSPQHCLPSEHWVVPRYSRFFKKCCVGAVVFCYLFYPVYLASTWDPSIPAPESASFCNTFRELLRMPGYPWLLACWICPFLFAVLPVFKVLFCVLTLFLSHNVFSFKVNFVCLEYTYTNFLLVSFLGIYFLIIIFISILLCYIFKWVSYREF